MKSIGVFFIIAVFLGISGFHPPDKKEKKAKQQSEMVQLIKNGRFRFVAWSATSELGRFDNFGSNYDLIFDSLQIKAYLPYYGRAYTVPYGGSGGVIFDIKANKIDQKWNEKKKLYTISSELADLQDSYSIFLTTGLNGYADLKISFRNRSWISYYGIIDTIESKNK